MPYIGCQLNRKIGQEQSERLEKRFGKTISLFPGIGEDVLMTAVTGDAQMAFQGKCNIPAAFLDVRIWSKALGDDPDYGIVSQSLIRDVFEVTGVPKENIYITFESYDHWGRKNGSRYMLVQ